MVKVIIFLSFCLFSPFSLAKVKVAIIDSGISQKKLKNVNYQKGYNFVLKKNSFPKVKDDHGTYLISILSGFPNQVSGIEIIPIQFDLLDENDKTKFADREDYYKALEYAINQKVDIISLSVVSHLPFEDKKERELFEKAVKRGIKVFVASGNEGKDLKENPCYPCSYNIKGIVCVGNISDKGEITSNKGSEVDIYVKGASIASGNTDMDFRDGSSMSTAILAHNYAMYKNQKKEKNFLKFLREKDIKFRRVK